MAVGLLLGLFVAPPTGSAQGSEIKPNVLRVSTKPDRSGGALLAGSVVGARIYVTLANPSGVLSTRFFIDDPLRTGKPVGADSARPYDARGGTTSAARPLPTYGLADGKHTLTVVMRLRGGGTAVKTARFTVRNTLPAPTLTIAAGDGRATLRWKATVRPSLAGFKVFRAVPGGRFVAVSGLLGVSARSWTQPGLVNGTRYGYIVQAVGTISRLTEASPARYVVPLPPPPPAPTVIATQATTSSVTLTWQAPNLGSTESFDIYRTDGAGTPSGPPLQGQPLDVVTRQYVDTTVEPGETYTYAVAARSLGGIAPSSPVTVMVPEPPPPPPPPPIASPLDLPTVLFAWNNGPSTTSVIVTNDSDVERTVTELSLTGPGSSRFSASLSPPQTLPVTLAPGDTVAVRVTFTTQVTSGTVRATLRLRGESGDPIGAEEPLVGISTTGVGGEPSLAQLASAYGLDDPGEVEIGDPNPATYPLNATEPIPGNAQLVRTFVTADPDEAVVIQLLAMFVAPSAEDVHASWVAADASSMDAFFSGPSGRRLLDGELVTTGPPGTFRLRAGFEGAQVDSNTTLATRPQVLCWPIADSDADGKPDRWLVSFDDSGTLPTGSSQGRDFNDLVYVLGNAEAAS